MLIDQRALLAWHHLRSYHPRPWSRRLIAKHVWGVRTGLPWWLWR